MLTGLSEKLLLKPKTGGSLQTERVPRSSVLDRLQSFLPQMAEANEKLRQQMEEAPAGHFDIESVEEAEKVIEMVSVGLLLNMSCTSSFCQSGKLVTSAAEDKFIRVTSLRNGKLT
uniref:Uncharacterized protein n=1 Tax=Amphiprion ocellaris TaxID=80972 RepID=A0AAQ5XKN0_AMPOC